MSTNLHQHNAGSFDCPCENAILGLSDFLSCSEQDDVPTANSALNENDFEFTSEDETTATCPNSFLSEGDFGFSSEYNPALEVAPANKVVGVSPSSCLNEGDFEFLSCLSEGDFEFLSDSDPADENAGDSYEDLSCLSEGDFEFLSDSDPADENAGDSYEDLTETLCQELTNLTEIAKADYHFDDLVYRKLTGHARRTRKQVFSLSLSLCTHSINGMHICL